MHATFDPAGEESIFAIQNKLAQKYIPHDIPSKGDLSSLHTLFQSNADGYHVSSYRYLWSEVMSADAFLAFQESIGGDDGIKEIGRRFRKAILDVGGGVSARESFQKFRGRDAKVDALLHFYGLSEEN